MRSTLTNDWRLLFTVRVCPRCGKVWQAMTPAQMRRPDDICDQCLNAEQEDYEIDQHNEG